MSQYEPRVRIRRWWHLAIVGVLSTTLVACTDTPSTPDAATSTLAPQSWPAAPTASATPPTDTQPAGAPGPCDDVDPAVPVDDESEIEQLGGVTLITPIDRGPMPHATGDAILDDAGVPVAYTVAENDVISVIGARFCVGEQWLFWVNYVRRDGDALYAGDTLNLDAHTLLSVGDQNGVVYNNALPEGFTIPPQH